MNAAIPTKYAGVQFRSRLEARWAAFFDLVGWRWEYEPIDLDGYIPDFIIEPPLDRPTLVEVKPIVHWPCAIAGCIACDVRDAEYRVVHDDAILKLRATGWSGPSLLVGAVLMRAGSAGVARVGRSAVKDDPFGDRVLAKCRRCPRVFLFWDVNQDDVQPGCDSCERRGEVIEPSAYWREAGNRVQWRAR